MTYGTVNADVIATSTPQGILGAGNSSIMKNRIINGAMVIDQRNAGASVTPATESYVLDRWLTRFSQASKFAIQQNAGSLTGTNLPVGFQNYMGLTVGASANVTVGAGDYFGFEQRIEGFNSADLQWGTANAKTVTLSFQIRSSVTGTFSGSIRNSASDYCYPFTYTVSSANTWTSISVTIAGPTSGTWVGSSNQIGIIVGFSVGTGSTYSGTANSWASATYLAATGATNLITTNSATFYITGVQLEVGSSATGFEYRQYGQEFYLCQRYYQVLAVSSYLAAFAYSTNRVLGGITYTNCMRAAPTATSAANAFYYFTPGVANQSSAVSLSPNATGVVNIDATVTATSGAPGVGATASAINLSAEL